MKLFTRVVKKNINEEELEMMKMNGLKVIFKRMIKSITKMKEGVSMKKEMRRNIPSAALGADTDPDILALRHTLEGNNDVEVKEDGTLSVRTNGSKKKPNKKGDIPKGVLGVSFPFRRNDSEKEESDAYDEESEENPESAQEAQEEKPGKKKGMIPDGVLGADSLRDMMTDPTPIPEQTEGNNTDEEPLESKRNMKKPKPLGNIPSGVLGGVQWYSKPEMKQQLDFEMKSMEPFVGKPKWGENCGVLNDGRMYWKVRQRIKADRKNGRGTLYDTNYEILLVYEPDHPKGAWGTSVHAYLKAPNDLGNMQVRVNRSARTPKNIPHVLVDSNGMKYLCTAHMNDFGTSYTDPRGVPTAKTAMLAAIKWLHNFECGLLSQDHWMKFQAHGVL